MHLLISTFQKSSSQTFPQCAAMWVCVILWNTINISSVEESAEISLEHTESPSLSEQTHTGVISRGSIWGICATALHTADGTRWAVHEHLTPDWPSWGSYGRATSRSLSVTGRTAEQPGSRNEADALSPPCCHTPPHTEAHTQMH